MSMTIAYHLKNNKFFITKEVEEIPTNNWVKKHPILTKRKFKGDFEQIRRNFHWNYGIENVRSDDDYLPSTNLSFVDKYNYEVKLDEMEKIMEQSCEECGKGGHNQYNCEEETDILGRDIFRFVKLVDEEDDEPEEEEEEEEYISWRRY